jgi:phage protein D
MAATPPPVYSARPTIAVGGRDDADLGAALLGLSIIEGAEGLYRCEALFGNWGPRDGRTGFLYFDRQVLDFGSAFAVKLGSATLFDGRITALEGNFPEGTPPQITVFAEDRLQDLRMVRRTRTFQDVADADVFTQIAQGHGLTADVSIEGPTHKVLAQVNQSDLAFLRERARAIEAELWVDGSTLSAKTRRDRRSNGTRLVLGGRLRELTVTADLAGQCTALSATGWDVAGKQALEHEASASVLENELGDDESGAAILDDKFGSRKGALAHGVPLTSSEARVLAEATFRHMARRFVVGRGVAEIDAGLRVGRDVDLDGLGPLFSGTYYLVEVCHRFDGGSGLRTELVAERPGLGRP